MKKTRRKYDREYKLMVVELSRTRPDTVALAKELDIRPELISRWNREFSNQQDKSFPGNGKVILTELEVENERLKKQVRDVEMERDILKKAVSIFSRNDGKYFSL